MSSQNNSNGGLSRSELWILGCFGVVLISVALFTGFRFTQQHQQRVFTEQSQQFFHEVGLRVVELRSVMKSMLGMHYASDEFAGADIDVFAAQLRQYSPFVHSLGMFEDVDGSMRSNYERWMANKSQSSFTIHDYAREGESIPSANRERFLPLISINPVDPASVSLLGTDFGSNSVIANLLQQSVDTGNCAVSAVPGGWPMAGNTLLIQPVYFGVQPPNSPDDRRELFAGGIWVSIDLNEMLRAGFNDTTQGMVTMQVTTTGEQSNLSVTEAAPQQSSGIDVNYPELKVERTWGIGDSRLSLTFTQQPRMPKSHAMAILLLTFATLLFVAVVVAFMLHRRVAQEERLRSLRAINTEREKAERTLESISDAVVALDNQLNIVYLNSSANRFLQLRDGDVLYQPIDQYVQFACAVDGAVAFSGLKDAVESLASDGRAEFDVALSLPHLADSTVKLTLSRMTDTEGISEGCIMVLQDVSKERKLSSELEYRANHDPLTGSYNRFYFEKRLRELVDDAPISHRQHALCYIDLDQFKIVNDTCGHPSGDRLLCELTEFLRARLRSADVLARLGGDEFGVIICDAQPEEALAVANKLYEFFQTFIFEQDGKAFPVHASIGFVEINKHNCDLTTIMSAADIACYTAKDSGRNALVVYSDTDESMAQRQEEMNWQPQLQQALVNDEFCLLVQAVAAIDPATGLTRIVHYEFLLRLLSNEGEEISPIKFIQAAERYDLMGEIDRWVIAHAFQTVNSVRDQLPQDCSFSINLSGQSAADPDLLTFVTEQMHKQDVDPERFWFEITETAAITHFSNAILLIDGIRALGSKVALDDFGSGLSSFGYLRQLPVDILKIDGQFVRDVDSSEVAREMVRAIDHVGKTMGLKTVAEFVESQPVLDELAKIKVDYAQGYHIAKPCHIDEALELQRTRLAS